MLYQLGSLQWIDSMGGPLILLPEEYLRFWSGHNILELEAAAEDTGLPIKQTDYERACAIDDYLGLVTVNSGQGVVLGDEPLSTAWKSITSSEGILTRLIAVENEITFMHYLRQYLERTEEQLWTPSGVSFVTDGQPLYLFDAVWSGDEVTEYLLLSLDKGKYEVDTWITPKIKRTELIMHRFRCV